MSHTERKNEIIKSFNNLILMMINHIANRYEKSYFAMYHNTIKMFINDRPSEPISQFIVYVYSNDDYRRRIKEENDSFFLGQNYNHITSGDKHKISKMFEFKDLWKEMDNNMRGLVKSVMKLLINQAEMYIDVLSTINKNVCCTK